MKARVIATGEIVEVKSKVITALFTGESILKYVDQTTGISYFEEDLFFPKDLTEDPDYWTRLEHQFAGMAMQGILSNPNLAYKDIITETICYYVAERVKEIAHALVEKYKKEEK